MKRSIAIVLVFAWLGACSMRWNWPRHEIDVRLHQDTSVMQGWTVDTLAMTVDRVELLPCAPDSGPRGYLAGLLVGEAHAHAGEVSDETLIADSVVVRPGPELVPKMLGVWSPWAGKYCALSFGLAAARPEARELGDMLGSSLMLDVTRPDGERLVMSTTWAMEVRIEFAEPLLLGDDDEALRVDVTQDLAGALMALDPEDDEPQRAMMLAMRERFAATWTRK